MQIIEFPSDLVVKEDEDTSIYQYRKGYNLQFEKQEVLFGRKEVFDKIRENVTIGAYSIVDLEIIKALFRFKWLNKKNIERYLNGTDIIHSQMKKPNYDSNIKRLRQDGVIATFSRAPVFAGEEHRVVVYRLSEGAYDYANAFCGIPKTYNKDPENMTIDTAKAMETLSLNQWYISMLINGEYQKNWYRARFKQKNGIFMIDSAFRLSVKKEVYGSKTMMLYAFPMPKIDDGYAKMINKMLALNSFLHSPENKYKCSLILTTCESTDRIKQAYAALRSFEELDDMDLLFALDNDSVKGTGIDKIYACEYNSLTKGIKYYATKIETWSVEKGDDITKTVVDEF